MDLLLCRVETQVSDVKRRRVFEFVIWARTSLPLLAVVVHAVRARFAPSFAVMVAFALARLLMGWLAALTLMEGRHCSVSIWFGRGMCTLLAVYEDGLSSRSTVPVRNGGMIIVLAVFAPDVGEIVRRL